MMQAVPVEPACAKPWLNYCWCALGTCGDRPPTGGGRIVFAVIGRGVTRDLG